MSPRPCLATALVLLAACGSSGRQPVAPRAGNPTPGGEHHATSSLTNEPAAPVDAGAPAAPEPRAPVTITAGTVRALPPDLHPRVSITAPVNNRTYRENRLEVRMDVRDWSRVPGADGHQHLHLILDNEPYRRIDDPSRPVALENLAEGTHVLRAFPGWHDHESVKTDGAFALVVFHVGRPTPGFSFDRRAPLLTYSRPKGEYTGDETRRILLDFYLTNVPTAELGPQGVRVRPTIDGRVMDDLTAWVPYWIEHLADGEHTIGLELIGRDGALLPGPFNRTERRITLRSHP